MTLLLVLTLVVGGLVVAVTQGWLSPFGVNSESKDSQVIQAINRTQEVSLLSLGIQGIKSERRDREILGKSVPGSGESVFIQYEFHAKLGIDGTQVDITKTGESAYAITVPEFIFIGYNEPTFELSVEDNGVLSAITPDIDKVAMVNEILNDDAQQKYLEDQRVLLEDQSKLFYDTLITSVDPEAKTTFTFTS